MPKAKAAERGPHPVVPGNPAEAPYIAITLDRPRRLLFDFNALIYLGEAIGENMLEPGAWDRLLGIKRDAQGKMTSMQPSPKGMRDALWAALLADDTTVDGQAWAREPQLTREQVGHFLRADNARGVLSSLLRAQNAQADPGDDGERPTEAAQPAAEESEAAVAAAG